MIQQNLGQLLASFETIRICNSSSSCRFSQIWSSVFVHTEYISHWLTSVLRNNVGFVFGNVDAKVVVPLCQVGMRKTTTDDVGDGWHGPRVEGKKPEVKEPEDFWSFFY